MRSRKYDGQSRSIESRLHLAGVRALEPIKGGPKAIQKEMEVIRELVSTLEASIPYIKYVEQQTIRDKKANLLLAEHERRSSFVDRLLGTGDADVHRKINELYVGVKLVPMPSQFVRVETADKAESYLARLKSYYSNLEKELPESIQRELARVAASAKAEELRESRAMARAAKLAQQAALAAAHLGNTRNHARPILDQIRGASLVCPYCGDILNRGQTHVDHIYPVSRGGLSTIENMVEVCNSCNLFKSNLPLASFIVSQRFDWHVVTARLEKLNKVY
jgi:5-methylcytosine-specific restriction endonuclease McrA